MFLLLEVFDVLKVRLELLVVSVINEASSAYSFGRHWAVDIVVVDGWMALYPAGLAIKHHNVSSITRR